MAAQRHAMKRLQHGLGLVEVMVGMVIGMVAILVVMQVFQLSEGARRNTVGGDDAQMAGTLTIASLQREMRQAGYGTSAFPILGCSLTMPGGWTIPALVPVMINPGAAVIPDGDPNTDTLLLMYGDSGSSPEGDLIAAQTAQNVYSVSTPTSFDRGHFVVAAPEWVVSSTTRPAAPVCDLTLEAVTATNAPSPPTVTVGMGVAGMTNGYLYNFGRAPRFLAYAVRGGNLTVCDYLANDCRLGVNDPAIWTPISPGVVSLRAVYGIDTSVTMDAAVDNFVRATPATQCAWARFTAVRMALVSRSGEFDRTLGQDVPAIDAPEWRASDAAPFDLTANADWQKFRYKVFETTIPVRNSAWQGTQVVKAATPC